MQSRLVKKVIMSLCLAATLTSSIWAADFKVDPSHSSIGFSVKHMFTNATGQFTDFKGSFGFDQKAQKITGIDFTITAFSLNTQNSKRDEHLKGEDFFDTASYPTITFKGSSVKAVKGHYDILGTLTLHGVSKEVVFKASFLGSGKNPWGQEAYSFTAKTVINRKDFGMVWNKELDKGGLLLGNDVTITVEIESSPIQADLKVVAK